MAASHDDYLKQEPLFNHPTYEKIATLPCPAGGAPTQVARRRATGEYVSIKFVARGYEADTTARLIRSTINHMELSTSQHPHVVIYKETFLTPHYLAMVTEYIEGETIENFLEKIGGKVIEGLAKFVFQQMVIALDYCHQRGKILRDVKLNNVLLSISEGQLPLLKLCDFTSSKDLARDLDAHPQDSSILYAAPEVLQNLCGGMYDGRAADLWACGIILYIMLFGRHPFLRDQDSALSQDQRMVTMLQRTLRGDAEYPRDVCSSLSPACLDLLHRIIQVDPSQRISMQQLMQHPWFLEALPEGAGTMNQVFLRDSRSLGASDIASIQAIMHRASTVEGDSSALSLHAQLMQVNLGGAQQQQQQQQQQAAAGGPGGSPQLRGPLGPPGAADPSTSSQSMSNSATTQLPAQQPGMQQQQGPAPHQQPYLIQQLLPGPSGGPQAQEPGTSGVPQPAAARQQQQQQQQGQQQPGAPQQQLGVQDSLRQGLLELDDSLMALPSGQLKAAAIEDILRQGMNGGRFDSLPSPVAPRSMSELERSLMASSSFMQEIMASGVGGMAALLGDAAAGGADAGGGGGSGSGGAVHIVDASPFLYDGPCSETPVVGGLPHASFSAMCTSFDFQSFNRLFSPERSEVEAAAAASAAAAAAAVPMQPSLDSSWARICRDASVRREAPPL